MTNLSIQPLWLTHFIEILLVLEFQRTKFIVGVFSYKAHFRPQISSNALEIWSSVPILKTRCLLQIVKKNQTIDKILVKDSDSMETLHSMYTAQYQPMQQSLHLLKPHAQSFPQGYKSEIHQLLQIYLQLLSVQNFQHQSNMLNDHLFYHYKSKCHPNTQKQT